MTDQAQNAIETRFRELNTLALTLAKSDWVNEIACMQGDKIDYQRIDAYEFKELRSQFRNYVSLNTFIYKIGLIFYNKNTVITPDSTVTIDWFFSHDFQYESLNYSAMADIIQSNDDERFLRTSIINYYNYSSTCFTYFKHLPLVNNPDNVQLIVAIREDSLEDLLQKEGTSDLYSFIFDEKNAILTAVNAKEDLRNTMQQAVAGESSNGMLITAGDEKYYEFSSKSETSGWTYAVAIPQRVLLGKVNEVRIVTFLTCFTLIAAGIFLAWGLAERNYKPLKRLINTVIDNKGAELGQNGDNEIEMLQTVFSTMAMNRVEMEERIDKWSPYVLHSFFVKLLNGFIDVDEIPLVKKYMYISDEYSYWTVAIYDSFSEEPISFTDAGISQWRYCQEWTVYVIPLEKNRCALVINSKETIDKSGIAEDLNRAMHLEHKNEGFAIGIGRTYSFIGELANSYIDALFAAEYLRFTNNPRETITFYNDIKKSLQMKYFFPIEKEELLINYLRTGNIDRVNDTLQKMLDENLSQYNISPFAIKCLFYNLISIALKTIQEDEALDSGILNVENDLLSKMPLSEMRVYIEQVYSRICSRMLERKANRATNGIQNILKYVNEQACKPDISLSSVAAHFGISTAYLCRYFKEQTGTNFGEYVSRKRITMARELVKDRNLRIEDISAMIGYDNILTFRRAFKKFEGVAPSEFRAN